MIGVSHLDVLTSVSMRAGWLFQDVCFYEPDASDWTTIKKKKEQVCNQTDELLRRGWCCLV